MDVDQLGRLVRSLGQNPSHVRVAELVDKVMISSNNNSSDSSADAGHDDDNGGDNHSHREQVINFQTFLSILGPGSPCCWWSS